jgi:LacI family transcriptional regulator
VIISQSHESYDREILDLQYLSSRGVDGILISVSTETSDYEHIRKLHERGLPIVLFDRIAPGINTHTIIVDNFKGAYEATEHLITNGYKRIAAISTSEFLSITTERVAGYKEALQSNGITVNNEYIKHCFYGGMVFAEVEEAINQLMTLKEPPEAIVTLSDKLTIGSLRTFKRRGLRIPDNIAIVGFSNSDLSELTDPALTVVRQPAFEMGKAATELLLQLIESKRPVTEFEKRILSPEFIVMESGRRRT